jgi:hypothetical protein
MNPPVSPEEYGEGSSDEKLEADGYAAGLDVWGQVKKAYGNYLMDGALANSQLWSLREAIRQEFLDEHAEEVRQVITGWWTSDGFQEGADGAGQVASIFYPEEIISGWERRWHEQKGQRNA